VGFVFVSRTKYSYKWTFRAVGENMIQDLALHFRSIILGLVGDKIIDSPSALWFTKINRRQQKKLF
jgi:hypothetical protein